MAAAAWNWQLNSSHVYKCWSSGNNFSVTKKGRDKRKRCLQLDTKQHNHPSYTRSTKTHWNGWHHTYLHHFALSNPTCALGKSLKTWSETMSFSIITKKTPGKGFMKMWIIKRLHHLENRDKDPPFRRDVSGGREGALVSPGVGHNLKIEWQGVNLCHCTVTE